MDTARALAALATFKLLIAALAPLTAQDRRQSGALPQADQVLLRFAFEVEDLDKRVADVPERFDLYDQDSRNMAAGQILVHLMTVGEEFLEVPEFARALWAAKRAEAKHVADALRQPPDSDAAGAHWKLAKAATKGAKKLGPMLRSTIQKRGLTTAYDRFKRAVNRGDRRTTQPRTTQPGTKPPTFGRTAPPSRSSASQEKLAERFVQAHEQAGQAIESARRGKDFTDAGQRRKIARAIRAARQGLASVERPRVANDYWEHYQSYLSCAADAFDLPHDAARAKKLFAESAAHFDRAGSFSRICRASVGLPLETIQPPRDWTAAECYVLVNKLFDADASHNTKWPFKNDADRYTSCDLKTAQQWAYLAVAYMRTDPAEADRMASAAFELTSRCLQAMKWRLLTIEAVADAAKSQPDVQPMGIPGGARPTPAAPRPPLGAVSKTQQAAASQQARNPASSASTAAGSRHRPEAKPSGGASKSEPIPEQPRTVTWTHDKVRALVEQVRKVPKLNPRVSNSTLRHLNQRHKKLKKRQDDAIGYSSGRAFDLMCREANKLLTAYNKAVPKQHRKKIDSFGRIH